MDTPSPDGSRGRDGVGLLLNRIPSQVLHNSREHHIHILNDVNIRKPEHRKSAILQIVISYLIHSSPSLCVMLAPV